MRTSPSRSRCGTRDSSASISSRNRAITSLRLPSSLMKHDAQKRTVDGELAVTGVIDEAELLELVQKEIHPRARRAHHVRERVLREVRDDALRRVRLAVAREQEQRTCQPPLARVEQLIDQVLLDPQIPGHPLRDESI